MTLFVAAALHAVIILGIGFGINPLAPTDPVQRMEITLVHNRSDDTPEDAKYLAQANQEGGGDTEEPTRPTSPASTPAVLPSHGTAAFTQPQTPTAPKQKARRQVVTTTRSNTIQARTQPSEEETPDLPTAEQLISQSFEMASASAEINRVLSMHAQRPRQKYISASTKEYKYAAYEEAWRVKVERIGNLNYPEEARRRNLSGALILDVALKPNGAIHSIEVLKSSGHQILDDAAQRIVYLAAPFAPFPPKIRAETDILHIIRTWRYGSDYRLSSH